MKSSFQIAQQKAFLSALLPPLRGLIALMMGTVMLWAMDPFSKSDDSNAIENFALSLILMSAVVYFAVPFIGNKIGMYVIMRKSGK